MPNGAIKMKMSNGVKIPNYIILTPTAPFKLYCFEQFLKNILSFKPKPKEMVFCIEPGMRPEISKWRKKLKQKRIKLVILELEQKIIKKFQEKDNRKLTYSREYLRNYFINSSYDWALWLDCDILPDKNVAKVLLKIAQSEKCLVISNQYKNRRGNKIIAGAGCTLTHKKACEFAKFQIASMKNWAGEPRFLADDFWFFAMIQSADQIIKDWTGWNGRKVGRFVSVSHINERGETKFLEAGDKLLKKY